MRVDGSLQIPPRSSLIGQKQLLCLVKWPPKVDIRNGYRKKNAGHLTSRGLSTSPPCHVPMTDSRRHGHLVRRMRRKESRAWGPGFLSCPSRSACYFRSSSCPVHEPRIRRILPRSTAPLFDASKDPSTCFAITCTLGLAPSKPAPFL